MTGTIKTICAECGAEIPVEVNFPAFNKPFEMTKTICPICETELNVYDQHKYRENGTIINPEI